LSILKQIIETKKNEIKSISINNINNDNEFIPASFKDALNKDKLSLIAEVKQASPSKGIIYKSFDPVALAKSFEHHGASAISVLTDKQYFKGSNEYLTNVKKNSRLPILRKDFIIDPIQVIESKAIGADAILLILDILTVQLANEILSAAKENNIDVLIEVHENETLEKLPNLNNIEIIGINNRNLNTFETNITHAIELTKTIKKSMPNKLFVAESGYDSIEHLKMLEKNNMNGVLIGEGLSKNKELLEWFNYEN
tara:strand:+ start:62 stop:826 length:765 start_codon:yes stop_codon:yes gene_type:complete